MNSISNYKSTNRMAWSVLAMPMMALLASAALGDSGSRTYTVNADFDEGTLINVTYDVVPDQLQLLDQGEPFNFIWVAASARGTIVKIDTETGAVLGEYQSAPDGRGRKQSLTPILR